MEQSLLPPVLEVEEEFDEDVQPATPPDGDKQITDEFNIEDLMAVPETPRGYSDKQTTDKQTSDAHAEGGEKDDDDGEDPLAATKPHVYQGEKGYM